MKWVNKTSTRGLNLEAISYWEMDGSFLTVHMYGKEYQFSGKEASEIHSLLLVLNKELLKG